jgi:hypothetical protein
MSLYDSPDQEPISLWTLSRDSASQDLSSLGCHHHHVLPLEHLLVLHPPHPNEWSHTTTNPTTLCPHAEEDLPPSKPKDPITHDLLDLCEGQETTP